MFRRRDRVPSCRQSGKGRRTGRTRAGQGIAEYDAGTGLVPSTGAKRRSEPAPTTRPVATASVGTSSLGGTGRPEDSVLDFGKTWIGRIGTISPDADEIVVDTAKLLRYLLLFDEVIVQSTRLREFNVLASVFGAQGLTALLRSGGIRVLCDAVTIGQTGQSDIGGRINPLPLGSYSFRWLREADRKTYLHGCFENVKSGRGLTYKESKRLKHEIATRLVEPEDTVPMEMEEQLLADLRSSVPHLSTALSVELRRNHGISARPSELRLNVHEVCERDFRVESNLPHLTSLDEITRHKAIERALLAVGGLNQRLAEMNGYNALTDFWYRDLPVLGSKFRYFRELGPERQDRALATVLARISHQGG